MIRTYGCQMNERDSESISWILSKEGFVETNNMEDADIVIFNTCAVRQNAENKLIGNLGDLKHTMEAKNLEKDYHGLRLCYGNRLIETILRR